MDLREVIYYTKSAKTIFDYWKPSNRENRLSIKRDVAHIRKRENRVIRNFEILWVCIVVSTVILHIFQNKILALFQVESDVGKIVIMLGITGVINLFAGVIVSFKR